ncbi:AAA family ATPase [Psychrobacter sanguinis]|uniref:AAA family ATPase n=1 Tax=Psychrobacter sanguinis TaxID=861445 RepID=UPI00191A62AD|nr:AAA family ATPase [Psychrobacter sanguinis]MCC3308530.1 AAA family ATPase [Psychrobacter sanguinis]UEC25822.1 AAA family ATPase [Psychrobacter sanguinis]
MRLKSLKLAGFKSFANPTTFTFRHGITAIVGPNGCGKSNVIDAIRWVLGESSAKQLRGGAMSDVIFAGTQNKAAKSVASVELTFEHTQDEQTGIRHELNLYHELSVRRQINVEGKSDYFINGTRCRRRDVVDVFLGTGLGPRSYSVIQQGMIGRIVDSSPQQLREFIEEAAGVSRYQARREETQKKLLKTRENLERLNDIEAELSRQKKKLVKQAESANQYQQIQQELAAVKEQLAIHQLCQAKAAQLSHKANQDVLTKSVTVLQQQHEQLKNKFNKLSDRLAEEQWLKDEARDKLHLQDMQRQQEEHQLNNLQANINQLDGRYQANLERQKRAESSLAETQKEQQAQAELIASLTPKITELEQRQTQTQQAYAPLQVAWDETNAQVMALEKEQRQYEQQLALDKQAAHRVQQDLSKWQTQQSLWQQEAVKWGVAQSPQNANNGDDKTAKDLSDNPDVLSDNPDTALVDLEAKLSGLIKQQETVTESLETEQPALNKLSQTVTTQQTQLAQLEKQHASLIAEYETLHSIVHPKKDKKSQLEASDVASASATTDSALKDNQSTASLSRLNKLPALHQQIKLSKAGEQYALVLDRWLAFWLDSRVMDITATKDKTEVGQWYQLLSGLIGSESDLAANNVLNQSSKHTSRPKQNQNKQKDSSSENEQAGSVLFANSASQTITKAMGSQLIPLSDLITTPKLGLWQQCYLYADKNLKDLKTGEDNTALQMAAELIVQLPQFALIITASGWVMGHFGAIHLSKLSGESQNAQFLSVRLQQQQRLAILEDQLNEIEAQMEQLSQQLKANQLKKEQGSVVVEELSAQLSTLTHSLHNLKQQQVELRAKQDRQNSEQQRLKQQRQQLDEDYQQLQQELTQLTVSQEQAKKELHTVEPKLIVVKDKQQQLQQQRQVISQQEREDGNSLRQLQLEVSRAELAEKHNQQQLQQLSIDLKQLKQAEQRLQQEQQKLQQQLPKLDASLKQTRSTHHEMQTALDERNAIINTLQTEANDLQQQRDDTEQQLQQQQQQLAETVTQVAIANERISEAGVRLTQVNNELTPETILTDYLAHGRSLSEVKLQKLQSDDLQLSAKLNNMGPVNLAAAAELAAVDERLLPLEQQINDITASMATLTDAIASIDAKTKTLFLETLDSVNESLTNLFTKVFGGGQASLTLSKEEDLEQSEQWRAGLELMAQPKGKKNSRLAVLSGGEKTLTALSLIFAIFKQHPAPFCVLDEVDAPLDDANVMRFTNLISDLADEVQFIFISHNKLAMQIADELKGVTMPQPGISTLVSVSLEEAEQYLDPTA